MASPRPLLPRPARSRPETRAPGLAWLLAASLGLLGAAAPAVARSVDPGAARAFRPDVQDPDDELEQLLAAERTEADLHRRRGRLGQAVSLMEEHLEEDPQDARARLVLARVRRDQARHDAALDLARRVREDAARLTDPAERRAVVAEAVRLAGGVLVELGRLDEARTLFDDPTAGLAPAEDPRDAWAMGRLRQASGDVAGARALFEQGGRAPAGDWTALLARGHCLRAAGDLVPASRAYVEADRATAERAGPEPDVLTALADAYFESEREVAASGARSSGALYREALELCPEHAGALLGQYELHRYNRRRQSRQPEEILAELLAGRPEHVGGLVAGTEDDLADGKLRQVRDRLTQLDRLAPERRDVRTLHAALAWVEHRREDCTGILAELTRIGPEDSRPERTVGRTLVELYRFAEAVPFLRAAVARDRTDHEAWTVLGQALANTGDEVAALEALRTAETAADGRQDARRRNLRIVLERMERDHVVETFGELSYSWRPDAADVLRTYLVPFYHDARETFAERYGHTPEPTRIEVFRRFADFSVRSVGFEGFPALGVCFGPVVTSVSPLAEIRGSFSWARTAYHEFSHVVHLGLSHNRCPRWITEGMATWEEVQRDPTWTRNMRRELVASRANGDLIRVRDLNRAFRGPRILFGYYQGGLLVDMLEQRHGFAPLVGLLEAFDEGLDLDQAFARELGSTPEEVDARFEEYVDGIVAELAIEPRWDPRSLPRRMLRLGRRVPEEPAERAAWVDGWLTVAWGRWQSGQKLDAEEALRRASEAGELPPRALFLRGEMALAAGDTVTARDLWNRALAAGGVEYRAMVALGTLELAAGEDDRAEELWLAAEGHFPGYDEPELSAERRLVELYTAREQEAEAMDALGRWLEWNAGEFDERVRLAEYRAANGAFEEAERLYREACEVDLFRRDVHEAWGDALYALERWEEAEREYRVATVVPAELDPDHCLFLGPPGTLPRGMTVGTAPPEVLRQVGREAFRLEPLSDADRARLLAQQADCAARAGARERGAELARRALELDDDQGLAQEVLGR